MSSRGRYYARQGVPSFSFSFIADGASNGQEKKTRGHKHMVAAVDAVRRKYMVLK
jgi:hypothetical protein